MRVRILRFSGAVAMAVVAAVSTAMLAAQAPSGTKNFDPTTTNTDAAVKAAAAAQLKEAELRNWTPPKTTWGDRLLDSILTVGYDNSAMLRRGHKERINLLHRVCTK